MKTVFAPHLGRHVKLGGRRRPRVQHPHPRLARYLKGALPQAPSSCDFSPAATVALSNVYDNDTLGDCVIAGGYHVTGVATGNAGQVFVATNDQIIADYSAIGGYVPGNASTDNGCDLQTALAYWIATGFANGTKLLGYLTVDPANQAEMQAACFLFENLYMGLELPDAYTASMPTGNGFVWDVGTPDPNQGHCIMACGYDSSGLKIDTWGLLGTFTWAGAAGLLAPAAGGELYVVFTPDQLAKGQTKAPNGVDWSALIADWNSIGGTVPVPAPPAPAPAPVPTIVAPTLDQVIATISPLWSPAAAK